MFGTCELCEEQNTEVMFAKGVEACYACLRLTEELDEPIQIIDPAEWQELTLDKETL
jgi:hypothetical protein